MEKYEMMNKLEDLCQEFIKSYIYIDVPNKDITQFLEAIAKVIKEGGHFDDVLELANRIQRPLWE